MRFYRNVSYCSHLPLARQAKVKPLKGLEDWLTGLEVEQGLGEARCTDVFICARKNTPVYLRYAELYKEFC